MEPASRGGRALLTWLSRQEAFVEMMPLAVDPRAKYGTALRLRTLCRQTVRAASTHHLKLCWQLLQHRGEKVRGHIERLVECEGQSIWRASKREASEKTDAE